ncbi:hypothetical protein DLAC_03311 [Tieghemostelium lacteum]|uniref:Uncharacterized protein n=1 Tax=Tieghemostelium lacteum TaxID=361077 RepID=A0A152A1N7_TIELA|nr:hypothetical protein DLAC_03311 [Tieghemostelium lacteum]|eukprot:KYR00158.1 hypothetical protein DLAC_03311 [Tieghemostelium lacteum]
MQLKVYILVLLFSCLFFSENLAQTQIPCEDNTGCVTCLNNTYCQTCYQAYAPYLGGCYLFPGCYIAQGNSMYDMQCISCWPNYVLVDGQCTTSNCVIDQCQQCYGYNSTSSQVCLTCNVGYELTNSNYTCADPNQDYSPSKKNTVPLAVGIPVSIVGCCILVGCCYLIQKGGGARRPLRKIGEIWG